MTKNAVQVEERTLPHNLEAERSILGAVLVHNSALNIAAQVLRPEDFFRAAHSDIFSGMVKLAGEGVEIDLVTLKNELARVGKLDEVGGPSYISSLADGVPKGTNVKYYAGIVREKAQLRMAIYAANKLLADAYEASEGAGQVIDDGVRALMGISVNTQAAVIQVGAAALGYMSALDEDGGLGIPTGFIDLDSLIGGFRRKTLTIIAARPSVGKTSFAVTAGDNMAESDYATALISLEMDQFTLAGNLVSAHARVPSDRIRRKMVKDKEWAHIAHAVEILQHRRFYIVRATETLTQVAAMARYLKDELGVSTLMLDYIQLMGDQQSQDRNREIAHISRGMKRLAEDLDIAVVALSQLSRAPEGRSDKRPQLSDLRESGALEQDADLALLLFREEMYKPRDDNFGVAEVIVAKNRTGPTGTVKLTFLKELARFENMAMF